MKALGLKALCALMLCLLACLAGCGDEPDAGTAGPVPAERENAEQEPPGGVLAKVLRSGKLVAGVAGDLPPFGSRMDGVGEPEGFEIDLVRALASYLEVSPEFVVLLPSERLPALTAGRVDLVAAGMAHTFSREEAVDFTLPVFMDGQKLLVHKGSGIRGPRDLAGRPVAAARGAGDAARMKRAAPEAEVRTYDDYVKAFLALKRGEVHALTADATVLLRLRAADVDSELWEITGPYLSRLPYAMAVPENRSDFRDALNKGLAHLQVSGDFERIYKKWFGPDTDYRLPLDYGIPVWPGATEKINVKLPEDG
jgi:polar amino acid transport system substrate-binding protein